MNFELSEEQTKLQKVIREFASSEIAPHSLKWDEQSHFPVEVFKQMGELGLLGIPFPEEYGGIGLGTFEYALAVEEIGKACGGVGLSYAAAVSLGASPIYYFGTKKQKESYLIPMAQGQTLGAFGLTEPNAGSDAGSTRTTAKMNDDGYIINGEKCWITNASHSNTIITTASVGIDDRGKNKICAFIVDAAEKGVEVKSNYDKMGVRASNTCAITYDDVFVLEESILGEKEKGFQQFLYTLDGGRISIAALSVGIAQAALEKTLQYAKTRKQFGKTISSFQGVSFQIADMATEIECARNLVYKAAWLKDQGKDFGKIAAMAKLYASEAATKASLTAIQIHGGNGYMKEYGVEKLLRDAKLMEIGEGTSEIQRVVISRLLGC